jgi:hypothetical protein
MEERNMVEQQTLTTKEEVPPTINKFFTENKDSQMTVEQLPENIKPFVMDVLHNVKDAIENNDNAIGPTFFLIDRLGKGAVNFCTWKNKEEKALVLDNIKREAKKAHIQTSIFVSESWALTDIPKEEVDAWVKEHKTIATHPKCKSIVCISIEDTMGLYLGVADIHGLSPRRTISEVLFIEHSPDSVAGAMTGIIEHGHSLN